MLAFKDRKLIPLLQARAAAASATATDETVDLAAKKWRNATNKWTEEQWTDIWNWAVNVTNKKQSRRTHLFLQEHLELFREKLHFPADLELREATPVRKAFCKIMERAPYFEV